LNPTSEPAGTHAENSRASTLLPGFATTTFVPAEVRADDGICRPVA